MVFASRSRLPFCSLLIFGATLQSCRPTTAGRSTLLESASEIFVALFDGSSADKVKMQVSHKSDAALSLCVTASGGACDSSAEKLPLNKMTSVGDRFIYNVQNDILPATAKDYLVLDPAGLSLFRFKLKPLGTTGADPVGMGLAEIMMPNLRTELAYITDDRFKGRLSATPENDQVADWLIDHARRLNLTPAFGNEYRQRFRLGVGPTANEQAANIIGVFPGQDPVLKDEYIVIGAHMDHAGTLQKGHTCNPGNGDSICNGADDNGSGTIALLNIAKALNASRLSLKRSVIIMWFAGEEEGLIGSKYYVKNPIAPLNKHVYMINLDMVGYSNSYNNTIAAINASTSAPAQKMLLEIAKKYPLRKIKPTSESPGGSDHAPFMNNGVPGVFFNTGVSNNKNYHKTSDHADLIDYEGMNVATQIGYEIAFAVANSPEIGGKTFNLAADGSVMKYVSDEAATIGCHNILADPMMKSLQLP